MHSPQVREFTDGNSSEALSKSRNFAYASPIRSLEIGSSRITRTRDVSAPLSEHISRGGGGGGGAGGEEGGGGEGGGGGGEGGGGGGFFIFYFFKSWKTL